MTTPELPALAGCHRLCLTPTRNERWIIAPFLAATRMWATRVIIADQGSTDGTREFLNSAPGVEVLPNPSTEYDEAGRQRLLLSAARRVEGPRLLLGLDADEALSANCAASSDWVRIAAAAPGTVVRLRWVNLLPGLREAWIPPSHTPFGFIDDGSPHEGRAIHSPRVPHPAGAPFLDLDDIVVLHFQYTAWERMRSKQRWYQVWELLNGASPLQIYRQYHHMHGGWPPEEIAPVDPAWLTGFAARGADFDRLESEPLPWWDREVVKLIEQHGPGRFRRLAIWDRDWNAVARQLGHKSPAFADPRGPQERGAHRLLALTQARRGGWSARGIERALRLAGW